MKKKSEGVFVMIRNDLMKLTQLLGLVSVLSFPLLFLPMLKSSWSTHWWSSLPLVFSALTVCLLFVLWWSDR